MINLTDGGKSQVLPHEKLDCVVRALAIVCEMPYYDAHKILKELGRKDRHTTDKAVTVYVAKEYVGEVTFCNMTLNKFLKQHPVGTFFVHIRGHVFAVKDGVQYDTDLNGLKNKVTYFAKKGR